MIQRALLGVVLSTAWIFAASAARGADPAVGGTSPAGAQRGTEVDVLFNGARLADAQQILFYEPGLEVLSLEAGNDAAVKVRLRIAPDCRTGQHGARIRTATGVSNLRLFSVGALKETVETEPNNDFGKPQPIELESCVNGVVENEDVDNFLVTAKQGQRITAEVEGIRLGNTFFDPYVAILDMKRFELSASDDAALVWQDGVASVVAPADGTYVVQVRECAFGGNGACNYRLHVGTFPRPRAVIPAGGKPGEALEVRWLGDVLGPFTQQVVLPSAPRPNFLVLPQDASGVAASGAVFRVSPLGNQLEAEPNTSVAEANAFVAPLALAGVIGAPGDVDYYRFEGKKGQVLDVRVLARTIRSPLDSVLYIYNAAGGALAGNDDSGGPDSYLRFTVPEDGQYLLGVFDQLSQGGDSYAYRLEVTPVAPQLSMGLVERSQFVDITVSVPQGNRTACLVSAARADFGGDLTVEMAGLPAGVSLETVGMAANQTYVPVVFSAAADAPLAGALVDVIGKPVDANLAITGHLLQRTSLVRGQNNIHVWTHDEERMAAAVTQAVPFSIEIVPPKAPLVRDGTMGLKVVAKRQEGFTAPIAVRMLYDPPGVGSSGGISIAEGQTEAVIPLNANGGAEVKTWRIAVLGDATVGNGNVTVSTGLVDLKVVEPFFGLAFQAAAVEQGKETDVIVDISQNAAFEGPAKVELLGLPNEVTTAPLEFVKEAAQMAFKVKTTGNSPAGKHRTLLCRAIVTVEGEPVTHMIGTGELRIDQPLPPKPMETAAAPAAPPPPTDKPLTLLQRLRLERQQAKAARAAALAAAQNPPTEQPPADAATAATATAEAAASAAPPAGTGGTP